MLGFKFCTCWSLMEVTTHDRAKETKIGSTQRNRRKGKLDYWAICGDSTNGACSQRKRNWIVDFDHYIADESVRCNCAR